MACRTASRLAGGAAAILLATVLAGNALAADPSPADKTIAQSLFDEARRLMDQGNYGEACPRLADSQRLDPGGGTVLNLALCYEKLGKLALAYTTYNDAVSAAIAENRHERERFARDHAAALLVRLPHVTIRVVDADDAVVSLDGSPLPKSAWGAATAVDPGDHAIEASAPGRVWWKATLKFAEGESKEVRIALSPIPAATPPPSISTPTQEQSQLPPPAPAPAPERPLGPQVTGTRHTAAFYVLGGLGIASLIASGVTGAIAWSAHESVSNKCNSSTGFCSDASGISDASRAQTFAWISTGTLAGAVGCGVLMLALPMREPIYAGVAPTGLGGGAQVSLRVAWP